MNESFDSVYPDFLKAGLDRLSRLGAQGELLSLFAALEHFRRDLHRQDSVGEILLASHRYLAGLNLFRVAGFYLVQPKDFSFELALCLPEAERPALERAVEREIRLGRFAWALRQTAAVFFQTGSPAVGDGGVLHPLTLSSQVLGMFCGLLRRELEAAHEIAFSLLTLLLGASADAIATLRKTAQLTDEVKTLTGLLPICAWCRKIRDDRGYWEQLEHYVEEHSGASFSHGICPECSGKFLGASSARTVT
ncbi:MAG: hypothetical protein FJ387_23305 [Verrucomicrobia bacterium]|nr:hypothetical protein [Verrucomicrobiota bacterium]